MGYLSQKTEVYSVEEYEALEATSDSRHEFYHGQVWAMAGGTAAHNQLVMNCYRALYAKYREKGCRVFTENMKLEVVSDQVYFYSDVMVICEPIKGHTTVVRNPLLIVEVLSDSTEKIDLGNKVTAYTAIEGLQAYIIIAQKETWVRIYEKKGDLWVWRDLENIEDTLQIQGWEIPLAEIYQDIYQ